MTAARPLVVLGVPDRRGRRRAARADVRRRQPAGGRRPGRARRSTCSGAAGLAGQPGRPGGDRRRRGLRALPRAGRAPPRSALRDRRRRREGRRARRCTTGWAPRRGRRAGRSPSSSRPRSGRPGCWPSRSRSAGPAGRRRSPRLEPVFVGGSTVGLATLHNEDQVRAEGRPPRRPRRRPQGRRRHPRGRRPGPRRPAGRGAEAPQAALEVPDGLPVVRRAARPPRRRERHLLHEHRLPGPAGAADRPLRLARRHGHRGAGGGAGGPAGRARAWWPTRPTSTCSSPTGWPRSSGWASCPRPTSSAASRRRRAGRSAGCSWPSASATSGRPAARALARAVGTLDTLLAGADRDGLAAVEGIGPVIADSVVDVPRQSGQPGSCSTGCGRPGSTMAEPGVPPGGRRARPADGTRQRRRPTTGSPDPGRQVGGRHRHRRRLHPGGGRGGDRRPGRQVAGHGLEEDVRGGGRGGARGRPRRGKAEASASRSSTGPTSPSCSRPGRSRGSVLVAVPRRVEGRLGSLELLRCP